MMYIEPLILSKKSFKSNLENDDMGFVIDKEYKKDDKFVFENKIYICLKESSSKNPKLDTDKFLSKGSSNKYACIDDSIYSKSQRKDGINISFDASFGDIVFLQNCNFLNLEVKIVKENKEIYAKSFNMLEPLDIKEYMIGIRDYRNHIVISLPMSLSGRVILKMTDLSNIVSVGQIIYGRAVSLGLTISKDSAPSFSFIDLEYFSRDSDGNLVPNKKEVPLSLSMNVIYTQYKTKNISRLKKLKQQLKVWLPLTNSINFYGEIRDSFAIYGALTSLEANLISALGFDEKITIESST